MSSVEGPASLKFPVVRFFQGPWAGLVRYWKWPSKKYVMPFHGYYKLDETMSKAQWIAFPSDDYIPYDDDYIPYDEDDADYGEPPPDVPVGDEDL